MVLKILFSILFGTSISYLDLQIFGDIAHITSQIFLRYLKLISLPILFFAVLHSIISIKNHNIMKKITVRTVFYAVMTTAIAAFVSMVFYLYFMDASSVGTIGCENASAATAIDKCYTDYFLKIIPDNIVTVFTEGNVLGVMFIAILIGFLVFKLDQKIVLQMESSVKGVYKVFIMMAELIIKLLPFFIWAFAYNAVLLFKKNPIADDFILYIAIILMANLFQAIFVLPFILIINKISPIKLFKKMVPALGVGFFSKSSTATLPFTIKCLNSYGVEHKKASMLAPLCAVINMNACAAFILITVLFVLSANGYVLSGYDYVYWYIIAIISAIGNAAVPMGCYFMTVACLSAIGAPIGMMAIILPFHAIIDMLETAINIWSDACIIAISAKD